MASDPPEEEDIYNTIDGEYMEPDNMYSHVYDYPELPPERKDMKPVENHSYIIPDYKPEPPEPSKPVYTTLQAEIPTKPRKKPPWWAWALILIGLSILCTMIILLVLFIRGSETDSKQTNSVGETSISTDSPPTAISLAKTTFTTTTRTIETSSPGPTSKISSSASSTTSETPKTSSTTSETPTTSATTSADTPATSATSSSATTTSTSPDTPTTSATSSAAITTSASPEIPTTSATSSSATTLPTSKITSSASSTTSETPTTSARTSETPTTSATPTTAETSTTPSTTPTTGTTSTTKSTTLPSITTKATFPVTSQQFPTISTNNIVTMPSNIVQGPMSAQSLCKFKLNEFKERKIHSSKNAIVQPAGINTKEKCKQACLGEGRDALLPSGTTCYAAAFDSVTNTCVLTDSNPSSERSEGWVYIRVEYYCYPASVPGCNYRFRKTNNKKPALDNGNVGELVLPASSVATCADGCSFLSESDSSLRCKAFAFDRTTQSCTVYTKVRQRTELVVAEGTDYYFSGARACVNCGDLYPITSSGKAAEGGILQEGSFKNVYKCKYRCDRYQRQQDSNGSTCYGFDYDRNSKTCYISTTPDYPLVPSPNTVNYRRDIVCYACSHPTKYISTINSSPAGGRVFKGSSFNSPYWCGYLCQGQSVGFNSKTCYGFSFNHTSKYCTLYNQFDYDLGTIGGSPEIDHYRRLYQCTGTASCQETYSETSNSASTGGILQPKDIDTMGRCLDRCWGYIVATDHTCYGADFHRQTSRCYIYLHENYELRPSEGVDNYRRNMDCHLPY